VPPNGVRESDGDRSPNAGSGGRRGLKLPRIFGHHDQPEQAGHERVHREVVELDPEQLRELSNVFSAPRWLRDLGLASWLLAGVALLLAGVIWLAAATATIVDPVVVGLIIATVASPVVGRLSAHRVPRVGGAAIVLLAIIAIVVVIVLIVVGGITSQIDEIKAQAEAAAPKVQSWLRQLGLNDSGATGATDGVGRAASGGTDTLIHGLVSGIQSLAAAAIQLSFLALSIFFLLKDGPGMRRWVEEHMGAPPPVAHVITGGVMTSLRRYFLGVTLVAAFNGVVVGLGALILDVPLAGTIGVVTFVTAYIPYIGAFASGAFAVILALGAKGTTTALIMLVIVILANGLLQNIFQPVAFGATLKLNPLAVLIVTIGAGCLFGMIGLVLAAPLLSAARQIMRQLSEAKRAAQLRAGAAEAAAEAPA
jgi:predicted PurR-regulated permease PerM